VLYARTACSHTTHSRWSIYYFSLSPSTVPLLARATLVVLERVRYTARRGRLDRRR
jgi:hypothetical protein